MAVSCEEATAARIRPVAFGLRFVKATNRLLIPPAAEYLRIKKRIHWQTNFGGKREAIFSNRTKSLTRAFAGCAPESKSDPSSAEYFAGEELELPWSETGGSHKKERLRGLLQRSRVGPPSSEPPARRYSAS